MGLKQGTKAVFLICISLLYRVQAAEKEEILSGLADQESVRVTIYNRDLALVKEKRKIRLAKGFNQVAFREVSAKIKPETTLLRHIPAQQGFYILEQNFDFDLLTPSKLLEKYVGKKVHIIKTHPSTGDETAEEGTVLSANNGVVLRIKDRIEVGLPGRIVYHNIPANLRDKPTLVVQLHSENDGEHLLELSYLTTGLSWQADYVGALNVEENQLELNAWVTLVNSSGTTYANATLQLVAGDVNQVSQMHTMHMDQPQLRGKSRSGAAGMKEERLFDYHLYSLKRPTDIRNNQNKQVSLFPGKAVITQKKYVLNGSQYYYQRLAKNIGRKLKVEVNLEFKNAISKGLGIPLPKGTVRIYKRDKADNVQFIGEDRIDHTAEDELVVLTLGKAFDITAEKTQTGFRKKSGFSPYNYLYQSAFVIEIHNAKAEPVQVQVIEPIPGDWQIIKESHHHTKAAASKAVWLIDVPAKGKTQLTYNAEINL